MIGFIDLSAEKMIGLLMPEQSFSLVYIYLDARFVR